MILNYIKSTIHSLWQRKWFSLLTLLSIALSLMLVVAISWFYTSLNYPHRPELNKDRTFFLTAKVTDRETGAEKHSIYAGRGMYKGFYSKTLDEIETPQLYTIFDNGGYREFIRDNKIYGVDDMSTDGNFFKVFSFKFIAGKPYVGVRENDEEKRCVITKELAQYYFGTVNCIGNELISYNTKFYVSGVIEKPYASPNLSCELYIQLAREQLNYGNWREVAFLCDSAADRSDLEAEFIKISKRFSQANDKYDIKLFFTTSGAKFLNRYLPKEKGVLIGVVVALFLIIFILPILCLLNVLRNNQAERIPTIGIHRAFGASRIELIKMLILENVFLIYIGGVLGILLSGIVPYVMIEGDVAEVFFDFFNWRALSSYIIVFSFIGVLAGIIPATSISKNTIVKALNQKEND